MYRPNTEDIRFAEDENARNIRQPVRIEFQQRGATAAASIEPLPTPAPLPEQAGTENVQTGDHTREDPHPDSTVQRTAVIYDRHDTAAFRRTKPYLASSMMAMFGSQPTE